MIPPLLLDVHPGMTALDMCAAPGSKSVQILEALHGAGDAATKTEPGLLIANDSDAKRCHLLVHQSLHRVPGTGMMVTNHDAGQLPSLRLAREAVVGGKLQFTLVDEQRLAKLPKERVAKDYDGMLFDRILADVPCSGDGTMRKNLGIWSDWTVGNGIGLHTCVTAIAHALSEPKRKLTSSTAPWQSPAPHSAPRHPASQAWWTPRLLDVLDEPDGERVSRLCCAVSVPRYA